MGLLIGLCWKVVDPFTQSNIGFIGLFGIPTLVFSLARHNQIEDLS